MQQTRALHACKPTLAVDNLGQSHPGAVVGGGVGMLLGEPDVLGLCWVERHGGGFQPACGPINRRRKEVMSWQCEGPTHYFEGTTACNTSSELEAGLVVC